MSEPVEFYAVVLDAGGGLVDLLIDRDAEHYPPIGARVLVKVVAPPRLEATS